MKFDYEHYESDKLASKIIVKKKVKDGQIWVYLYHVGIVVTGTNFSLKTPKKEIVQWLKKAKENYINNLNDFTLN